jgi:Ni,Fe-hydrogenase I cytochrome b subunit
MDLTFDGGISNVVHWIRAVSLIGLIITLITLGNLLSEGEIVSEEKAAWFFHFIFYFIIFETIFTLFAIFVFNDIEIKDKDANEKKEELKKLKSQLPGSGGFCN